MKKDYVAGFKRSSLYAMDWAGEQRRFSVSGWGLIEQPVSEGDKLLVAAKDGRLPRISQKDRMHGGFGARELRPGHPAAGRRERPETPKRSSEPQGSLRGYPRLPPQLPAFGFASPGEEERSWPGELGRPGNSAKPPFGLWLFCACCQGCFDSCLMQAPGLILVG